MKNLSRFFTILSLIPASLSLRAQTSDPACSKSGVLFCTGFEESNWRTLWDDYDGNPTGSNDLLADPGPANVSGNHIMRLRSPAGQRGGADLVKVLDTPSVRLYARWYQKWETGYNFSAGCHNGGLHAGNRNYLGASDNRPAGDDWFSAWLEPCGENRFHFYAYYRGMFMDCADPAGSCWGDHLPCMLSGNYCTKPVYNAPPLPQPPLTVAGRWYCIEVMADAGVPTTDTAAVHPQGILDFWIDGVEYGPFQNLWLRTVPEVKPSILYISLFNHDGSHSAEGIMVDDVVVSKNYIGPRSAIRTESTGPSPNPAGFSVRNSGDGRIKFQIGSRDGAGYEINVYDILGRKVWHHAEQGPPAGLQEKVWPASGLSSGLYLASFRQNGTTILRRIALVR